MAHAPKTQQPGIKGWIEHRLPIFSFIDNSLGSNYPAPRNLNYWWNFGSIAGICLVIQILTGLFLSMHYTAHVSMAFNSVEHIMRDVNYGWLLRYMHAVGASMFFVVVYIHICRGLYYGSYKSPREVLWWLGLVIFLLMMATGFLGYVLPWGQMSFWGATVITNLFSAFPVVGESIVSWLWGGFSVDNPTLNRFYSLHFLLPFVIVGVVILHIWALHMHGSNNPIGIDVKGEQDTIPFHPYYTVKDLFGFGVFFMVFAWFVFFSPNSLGHPDNYIPANPLVTPAHIVPEWYYLPFYAILRATPDIGIPFTNIIFIPSKLAGVLLMFGSILIMFVLPWIDRSKVRSGNFRPLFRVFYWVFIVNAIMLGYLGAQPAEGMYIIIGRICLTIYFGYFAALWWLTSGNREKTLPLPESISKSVLSKHAVHSVLALFLASGFWFLTPDAAYASSDQKHPKQLKWSFDGVFGKVDKPAAQRGLQVYKEVCSACHGLKRVSFRTLTDIGFSEAEVKALAASYTMQDGPNDAGEMFERAGKPFDKFPSPFANEKAAAAANNGAAPPDLSLMVKARPNGANYIYSLLTGYGETPPEHTQVLPSEHYNPYFPGGKLAMAQPLSDGQVSYEDGTTASVDQMAKDVVTFLQWAAEPEMEHRKRMGIKVLLYLAVFSAFAYIAKKRIWRKIH